MNHWALGYGSDHGKMVKGRPVVTRAREAELEDCSGHGGRRSSRRRILRLRPRRDEGEDVVGPPRCRVPGHGGAGTGASPESRRRRGSPAEEQG
jgi:hypothetical protein